MDFYERLESLRKENGISQKSLEILLGFSNGSISKWKNHTPTFDRLEKLSNYFDVSIDYLLCKTDDKKQGVFGKPTKISPEELVKTLQQAGVKVEYVDNQKDESTLTNREKRLLTSFSLLTDDMQDSFLAMIESTARNIQQQPETQHLSDEKPQ